MLRPANPPAPPSHPSPRRLRVVGVAFALALLTVFVTATPTFAWSSSAFSSADEQLLVTLTNRDRASAGLAPLVNDTYLHKEAEWRAKDMGDRDYFSHTIPPGNTTVFADMSKDHYCYRFAGENIGLSTFSDGSATTRMETAFMGSKGHRANILGTWSRIGVGAYKAADGRKLYSILFSVPCASKTKAKAVAKPTAAPTPILTPTPTATPTLEPTLEPTALPVVTAAPSPTATAVPDAADPTEQISLRVRDRATSQGPLDSLLGLLFGGLFG